MNILGEIAGYIAGICIATWLFLPQTLQTIKDEKRQDLSLFSYIIYLWHDLLGVVRHLSAFGSDDFVQSDFAVFCRNDTVYDCQV